MPDRADASSDDFVCVATRDSPIEAHLLMGVLRSAALTPHLADEHMVQNYSLLSPAVGGVGGRVGGWPRAPPPAPKAQI